MGHRISGHEESLDENHWKDLVSLCLIQSDTCIISYYLEILPLQIVSRYSIRLESNVTANSLEMLSLVWCNVFVYRKGMHPSYLQWDDKIMIVITIRKYFVFEIKDIWNICLMISYYDISIDEMNSMTLDPKWTKRREEICIHSRVTLLLQSRKWTQLFLFKALTSSTWWRDQMETFSALLAICAVNSPRKGQWRGALMLSLICAWINGWVNNREAGYLRRHRHRNVYADPRTWINQNKSLWHFEAGTKQSIFCRWHFNIQYVECNECIFIQISLVLVLTGKLKKHLRCIQCLRVRGACQIIDRYTTNKTVCALHVVWLNHFQ